MFFLDISIQLKEKGFKKNNLIETNKCCHDAYSLAFSKFILVSEYINLFGYIQFGGILVTPMIGFVFDKSRLSSTKQDLLTTTERRLQRLRECIAPFLLTNVLCLLFCVLSMIEDIRFQVVIKYSVMQIIGCYSFILLSNNFDNKITVRFLTFFVMVFV